jgi:hypothetical protein
VDGLPGSVESQNKATVTSGVIRVVLQEFTAHKYALLDIRYQQMIIFSLTLRVE